MGLILDARSSHNFFGPEEVLTPRSSARSNGPGLLFIGIKIIVQVMRFKY